MTDEVSKPAVAVRLQRPVGRPVAERKETQAHDWRDDGCDTHKGEYWYRCALCGASDWIASYGTKDQLMPRECKPPNGSINATGTAQP